MANDAPELHIQLLPWQRKVWDDPSRFKILRCGRRSGKTHLAHYKALFEAGRGMAGWWVAPSYPMTQVAERLMDARIADCKRAGMPVDVNRSKRIYSFPSTGGWLQIRSADDPDSLVSEGLDFVIFDEAARMQERAWTTAIRPALMDRKGFAWFITTPYGRNWFFNLWLKAKSDAEWSLHHCTSFDNPRIDRSEIEKLREALPEKIFQQEVMAEFVDLEGSVFRHLQQAAYATLPDGYARGDVVVGVDWGKVNDFTVFTALDCHSGHVLGKDRSNKIDYEIQRTRLAAFSQKWGARLIVAEENSMGGPIIEALRRSGLKVLPITTTAISKAAMIESLALAFEQERIHIPEDDEELFNELMAYESRRTPSGNIQYGAPSGLHDDCVMSLALAWTQMRRRHGDVLYTPTVDHQRDAAMMQG